jgi:L-serine/L-threonine ammonia-lyase
MDLLTGLSPQVVTVETTGADCFARAVEAGELVTLPAIDSIAKSLGASTAAAQVAAGG